MNVIKASRKPEKFIKEKIENSIIKAGASIDFARKVSNKVKIKVKDGVKTEKILNLTLKYLNKKPEIAARYDLKRAIMLLGPNGFPFEEFFSQILVNYGYKTKVGIFVKGKVIEQEIDIIAERKLLHMIEAKYHNKAGIHTDTKTVMYTYARFLDIKSNPKNKFDQVWLVTNTKCTSNAIAYAKGIDLKIIGWSHPNKNNLQDLIMKKGLYPITIFKTISKPMKEKLFKAKIVLAKDLINHDSKDLMKKTGLSKNILNKVLKEIDKISYYKK